LLILAFVRAMGLGGSRLTRRLFLTTLGIGLGTGELLSHVLQQLLTFSGPFFVLSPGPSGPIT
jgi:hypothetical protein